MITRLYANNFRCLVGFNVEFDSFGVLCGPNGSGKSSIFDVLKLIRDLATGDAVLGGEGPNDIARLEFTSWMDRKTQEFELGISANGKHFEYRIHMEQVAADLKPRVIAESASCDGKELYHRDLDGVQFVRGGEKKGFPLDWRQAALGSIEPRGIAAEVEDLKSAIAQLMILRPNPRDMESESRSEAMRPDLFMSNLTSWYRKFANDLDWANQVLKSLQGVWPDLMSFKLDDVGLNAKALRLRFKASGKWDGYLYFDQLSDGEKALAGLYMIRTAMATGNVHSILIDEPDNFVGLPELQPWILSMTELLDENHQALIISHHPEILGTAGVESGRYLWRDNHASPTRMGPLKVPVGLTVGEAVARGWVGGK
jgi:predicted ATPase